MIWLLAFILLLVPVTTGEGQNNFAPIVAYGTVEMKCTLRYQVRIDEQIVLSAEDTAVCFNGAMEYIRKQLKEKLGT